jgi:hypothetical protein
MRIGPVEIARDRQAWAKNSEPNWFPARLTMTDFAAALAKMLRFRCRQAQNERSAAARLLSSSDSR